VLKVTHLPSSSSTAAAAACSLLHFDQDPPTVLRKVAYRMSPVDSRHKHKFKSELFFKDLILVFGFLNLRISEVESRKWNSTAHCLKQKHAHPFAL